MDVQRWDVGAVRITRVVNSPATKSIGPRLRKAGACCTVTTSDSRLAPEALSAIPATNATASDGHGFALTIPATSTFRFTVSTPLETRCSSSAIVPDIRARVSASS